MASSLSAKTSMRGVAVTQAARAPRANAPATVAVRAVAQPRHESSVSLKAAVPATLAATLLSAQSAQAAADTSAILSQVDKVLQGAYTTADSAYETSKAVFDAGSSAVNTATPYVNKAVEIATPIVEQGAKTANSYAAPVASDAFNAAVKAVNEQGIDTSAVANTAKQAAAVGKQALDAATPVAKSSFNFLTTTDPTLLLTGGAAAVAAFYLLPPVFQVLNTLTRGYAGDVSAPQGLDILLVKGNSCLLDIRTEKEKSAAGSPDLPGKAAGKSVDVPFFTTEDRKLRSMLRDALATEAQVTALIASNLKKLNKGTTVLILDDKGGRAVRVAKALAGRGFGNVKVIKDGFSGGSGWKNSKLQTKANRSVAVDGIFSSRGSEQVFRGDDQRSTPRFAPGPVALLPSRRDD